MSPRYLSIILLLALSVAARAGTDTAYRTVPLIESGLPLNLDSRWRYHPGDDPAWASPAHNDIDWTTAPGEFYASGRAGTRIDFPGVGWFRIWIDVDSALARRPLAIAIKHKAKARVYMDGRPILAAPEGKPELEGSVLKSPLVFTLERPGLHLIALRFEDSSMRTKVRDRDRTGFSITIDKAPAAIDDFRENLIILSSLFVLFIVFFFSFGIIHLILFLYFRLERSNAWFSLFCFSAGLFFFGFYDGLVMGTPAVESFIKAHLGSILATVFLTLSVFINQLFGRGRMRFRIAQIGILALIAGIIYRPLAAFVAPALVTAVCIEAMVLILRAIIRKEPGARIIGSGILLFALIIIGLAIFISAGPRVTNRLEEDVTGIIVGFAFILAVLSVPLSMSAYLAWNYASVRKGLYRQLKEVERLSAVAREHEAEKQRLLEVRADDLEREVSVRTEELRRQRDKSDELLENILPAEVAEELKEKGSAAARLYDNVSVLFTDFSDFTQRAETLSPEELVGELNECFSAFDGIITRYGLEKIKTVGDAYIAVSGLPAANPRHAQDVVAAALEVRAFMAARKAERPATFGIRLGVHSGSLVAGIVGVKKFAFDIWGDTVNTAARMEQHSEPGRINISAATYELVKEEFDCSYRGELEAKHKGRMGMYFVNSPIRQFHNSPIEFAN